MKLFRRVADGQKIMYEPYVWKQVGAQDESYAAPHKYVFLQRYSPSGSD